MNDDLLRVHLRAIRAAMSSPPDPARLEELAATMRDAGAGQELLFAAFHHEYARAQPGLDDAEVDAVCDLLDRLWGGGWAKGRGPFPDAAIDERDDDGSAARVARLAD